MFSDNIEGTSDIKRFKRSCVRSILVACPLGNLLKFGSSIIALGWWFYSITSNWNLMEVQWKYWHWKGQNHWIKKLMLLTWWSQFWHKFGAHFLYFMFWLKTFDKVLWCLDRFYFFDGLYTILMDQGICLTFLNNLLARNMFRSSRPKVFCKTGALKNFVKFTEKHLCQSLFLKKLQAWCLQLH